MLFHISGNEQFPNYVTLGWVVGLNAKFTIRGLPYGEGESSRSFTQAICERESQTRSTTGVLMARPTGPGKNEIRTNPPSLVLFNFDIDGDALKKEHIEFLRREAIPKLQGGASVRVVGLTDRKASAAHNQALSERRVARTVEFLRTELPAGLKLDQATGFGEAAAAREGEKDETLDESFRAVVLFLSAVPLPVTKNKVVEVTVKSFIALIGANTGTIPGFIILPSNPLSPLPLPVPRQTLLKTLAAGTDSQFQENPINAARDKKYRLFSSCRFTLVFEDRTILAAVPGIPDLDTDVGTEPPQGGLQPDPLVVSPVSVSPKGDSFVTFSWTAKGRPHVLAEPPFQAVQTRRSVFIWHIVNGRIDISTGTPVTTVTIQGSQFPSHRAFVNGTPVFTDIKQGPFSNLWVSDRSDPTKVR
jgi:outer membrane protein OmpA-like peptidoglycan-associated protein